MTRRILTGMGEETPVMTTWMEMVGLSGSVFYLEFLCPLTSPGHRACDCQHFSSRDLYTQLRERERDRERERQRDREREIQRQRQRDRETEKQREREIFSVHPS